MMRELRLATGEHLRVGGTAFAPAVTEGLQPAIVARLADGDVPALLMRGAVSPAWCDEVSDRFAQHSATRREAVMPPIYSLGSHLYSCPAGEAYTCYFRGIEESNAAISSVLPGGHDPIVSFLREACRLAGAQFAYLSHEGVSVRHGTLRRWGDDPGAPSGGRSYFAVPHEDFEETRAKHPFPDLSEADNVYSIALCIDVVEDKEPETIIWDRRLTLAEVRDPDNQHPWASYGYKESLLDGVDAMSFRLKKGDVAILPAHNVHAVVGFPGFRRCTYMAFFHLVKTAQGGFTKMIFRT